MPQQVVGGGDERKKRRPPPPPPAPTPSPDPTYYGPPADTTNPLPRRILKLNKDMGRVVPTEVTYALGQSKLEDRDLDKAARLFARQFDLSPLDFFTPVDKPSLLPNGRVEDVTRVGYSLGGVSDPATGQGVLSLRTARRLLEANEESIIRKWLEGRKATGTKTDAKGNVVRGESGVSSKSIIRTLNELTPLVGEDLNFGEAVEIARQVAETHSGKSFRQNLEVAMRTAFARTRKTAIAVAIEASKEGFVFTDVLDVAAFLGGATREQVAAGMAADGRSLQELKVNGEAVTMGVGELTVLGAIADALSQREQSFSEAADSILEEMRVEQSDDKSIAELWIGGMLKTLQIANRPMDAFFRVVADTDAILAPFEETGSWVEVMPDGSRVRHTEGTRIGDAVSDGWSILKGEQNILDNERLNDLGWSDSEILIGEVYLSLLIPVGAGAKATGTALAKQTGSLAARTGKALGTREGAAAFLRLGGEVLIDPLTGLGKLGKVSVGKKFLPLLSPEQQGAAVRSLLYTKRTALGNLDVPTYLVRKALTETDPEAYFTKAVSRFRSEFSRDGIHPMLANTIFRWAKKSKAAGADEETIVRGVREFFGQALGIPAPQTGLGAELTAIMERAHMNGRRVATANARLSPANDELLEAAYRKASQKTAQQLADQLDRVARDFDFTGAIMHEVPKIKALRTATGGARYEGAAARAWRALKINELPVRRGIRFNITPDLDPGEAADALSTVMTRSRVFNQPEIASFRQRLTSAMRPGFSGREKLISDVLDEAEDLMMTKLGAQLGVPPATLKDWTAEVFGDGATRTGVKRQIGYDPQQRFAAGADLTIEQMARPLRPAQLQNNFGLIDPVYVRKAAKETMGYAGELNAMALRLGFGDSSLGKAFERGARNVSANIAAKPPRITPSHFTGVFARQLLRPALGLVKFGWVARPAYVLRIVAGDELLRYAATEGLGQRLMGTKLAAKMLKNRNLPSVAEISLRTGLDYEDAIALKLTNLLDDDPQASQGAVRFIDNARGDILPADIEHAMVDRWDTLFRGDVPDKAFHAGWYRALFQYGQDATGRRQIQNFIDGMDSEDNIADLLQWHRTDDVGRGELKRMKNNVKEYDVEEATRISVEYLDAILPEKALLGPLLMDGALTSQDLMHLADNVKPNIIHGPAINPRNVASVAASISRGWGKLILELPTNKLIRQPFFKANYSTVYISLRERALLAGKSVDVPHPPTPELFRINPANADTSVMRTLSGLAEDEGTHAYHFTPIGNYDNILSEGLNTGKVRSADEVGVYFGSSHVELESLLPMRNQSDGVLLRIRRDAPGVEATDMFGGAEGEWIVRRPVRADELEVLSPEGEWVSLTRTQDGGIPASLDAAMQAEAKRFAIARTQQVMFDFTRTGRLSELMWFVSPFFQPFTEFFLAWPKIIRQNPAMVSYAYRLSKAANESGFFKTDEQTGEQVIPMSNLFAAAPLLALTTNSKMADSPGGGWELLSPVSSFNMFATNAYPYKFDGTTIPIPTPSFSPPVQWALQWGVDKLPINDATKQEYMAWLTEFGEIDFTRPQDFALPSWMRHALTAAVPSWFDDQTNQNVNRFMALQQAMGLPVDEASARGQAQSYGLMRAAISAFFPASPRVNFPTADLEAEWDQLREQYDGDSLKALAEFAGVYDPKTGKFEGGRHPGLTLIAISKTMWEDESNPFPMPANEASDRILNSTGGREFAKQFPRWAFFIIPKEIREGDFDLGAFYRQISEGRRAVRNPSQFRESAEVQNGWNAYFAVKTQWDAWQQAHPDQSSGDIGYDRRQGEFEEATTGIAEMFPSWDGAYELTLSRGVDPNVMAEARVLVQSEEFTTKTDGGAGLLDYMTRRDKLQRDMADANVSNLDTMIAERLGFVKRYENIVEETTTAHPDFGLMYDYLGFENDLKNVRTAGEKALDALPEDVAERVTVWQDEYERRADAPYDNITDEADRFAAYKAQREWANTAYGRPDKVNPLKLWWDTRNPEEKADYLTSLGTRSPVYWSRFDWDVMGIKQTKKQQQFWVDVDEARSLAFDGNDVGGDLDRIDRAINAAAKKDPRIKEQLGIINNWTFGLEQAVFNPDEGKRLFKTKATKSDWQDVFDASQTIHDYMNRYDMIGERDYDPDLRDYYDTIKTALISYVEKKKKDNPVFKQQWNYLQDLAGTELLIETFMPPTNYDIGRTDD